MKNIDKIRNMSADELAKVITNACLRCCAYDYTTCDDLKIKDPCRKGIKKWLESESEEE